MIKTSFLNPSQTFVFLRTYSRWRDDLGRRETWEETIDRVISFIQEERGEHVPAKVLKKIKKYMLSLDVLPSMRLVWAAGEAAKKDNTTLYNCSFLTVDSVESFAEALYILMCGTGVGFSIEKKHIDNLPVVPVFNRATMRVSKNTIPDDKAGWADSVKLLLNSLYSGEDVDFDYSIIRPKGSRLKTMGGRASGPEPLSNLHSFIREIFNTAQGRKLTPIECNDLMCKIAEIVVVGGVRRSSLISLSDLEDIDMRTAKQWPFPIHRAMANNSAVYNEKPSSTEFLKEWTSLALSGSGERGIFNLGSAKKNAPKRRKAELLQGVNPCGEVLLRSRQFCNLSSIVVKPHDTIDSLLDKTETAAWIGTIQASMTKFPYLRPDWKKNCDEEALLGVSLSGQMDNSSLLTNQVLQELKKKTRIVNDRAAKALGINPATAITLGKPEGTSSQLVYSGSGCHPWYSPYYIRRIRISTTDPLYKLLRDQGVEFDPEVGQTVENATTMVVGFPCKAPETAICREQMGALEQLDWYKKIQTNWCEHNQSTTIYVKDEEWVKVGSWVYENWDIVNGLSFLPYDGGKYKLAPYEEITKDKYQELLGSFPVIDYTKLSEYENEDVTEGAKSYACVSGSCDII